MLFVLRPECMTPNGMLNCCSNQILPWYIFRITLLKIPWYLEYPKMLTANLFKLEPKTVKTIFVIIGCMFFCKDTLWFDNNGCGSADGAVYLFKQ